MVEFVAAALTLSDWAKVVAASTVLSALINQLISSFAAGRRQERDLRRQTAAQDAAEAHQRATQARELEHQREVQEREHVHQRRIQEDQRRHEALLRQEAAHAAARDRFIAQVSDAVYWIEHRWGRVHGMEADWVPDHSPTPRLSDVADVCEILRTVEMEHPSRNVRDRAAGLREAIEGRYGSIEPVYDPNVKEWVHKTGNDPSPERFREWVDMGKGLIEATHTTGDLAD